jgi:hypothetical protein
MMNNNKTILLLLIILISTGCEKIDDPNKIEIDYQYKGGFSVIAGQSSVNLENMGIGLDPMWQVYPDSLLRYVNPIRFGDTIPFDLSGILGEQTYIKSISFIGNASNEFPTNDTIKFEFADKNKILIDSILPYTISIDSASFYNDSTIKNAGVAKIMMPFGKDLINQWNDVKYIVLTGKIINNITKFSQFNYYERYRININLAIQVEFDFNLNEFSNSK